MDSGQTSGFKKPKLTTISIISEGGIGEGNKYSFLGPGQTCDIKTQTANVKLKMKVQQFPSGQIRGFPQEEQSMDKTKRASWIQSLLWKCSSNKFHIPAKSSWACHFESRGAALNEFGEFWQILGTKFNPNMVENLQHKFQHRVWPFLRSANNKNYWPFLFQACADETNVRTR